jgi:hypothetical protein
MSEFALSGMYLEKARELLTVKNDLIRDTNDDTNFSDVMIGTKKKHFTFQIGDSKIQIGDTISRMITTTLRRTEINSNMMSLY